MSLPSNAKAWTNGRSRVGWSSGPWDGEPDKISWTDAATGRPCLIHRGPSGALCGYVAVDPDHPLYGVHYEEVDVEVHGGLTFAAPCAESDDESVGICHVPEPGKPDEVWWFGFDCAHAFDVSPAHDGRWSPLGQHDEYRDVAYVVSECERLAAQLVEVQP